MNTEEYIIKAKAKHGDLYDYTNTVYSDSKTKVIIKCMTHGDFSQSVFDHLKGAGCSACSRERQVLHNKRLRTDVDILAKKTTNYITKANAKHGDLYDYSKTRFVNEKTKVTIGCLIHGDFIKLPGYHIKGQGCPKCSKLVQAELQRGKPSPLAMTTDEFILKSVAMHGERYDYSNSTFINSHLITEITCLTHGKFSQRVYSHVAGKGCPICGHEKSADANRGKTKVANHEVLRQTFLSKLDGHEYSVKDASTYTFAIEKMTFVCKTHGDFEMSPINILLGCRCRACNFTSKPEQLIVDMFGSGERIIRNDRTFGFEFDVYLPDRGIAVEINGVKWHSAEYKNRSYHRQKTIVAEKNNIRLYHFWDEEIYQKPEIIRSVLNVSNATRKIYARQCVVKEVSNADAVTFLSLNHLQGSGGVVGSCLGLYFSNELVALMSFKKCRFGKKHDWELYRFCTALDTVVVGGASKLLSALRKIHPGSVVSYANRRWSQGNVYEQIGFTFLHLTDPGYSYTDGKRVIPRQMAMKHKLPDLLGGEFDDTMTEEENMEKNGWHRLYDCGNIVYEIV